MQTKTIYSFPTYIGQDGALAYAKHHFAAFQRTKLKEIMRLMGCLVYLRPTSRYGIQPVARVIFVYFSDIRENFLVEMHRIIA
jgi:hypothetical protein